MTTIQPKKSVFLGKTWRFALVGATSLFGVLYLIQTSALAVKGYDIADLQRQMRTLEQDNQSLDWQIAEYKSMGSIQTRLKDLNLVAANDAKYVSAAGGVVAKR